MSFVDSAESLDVPLHIPGAQRVIVHDVAASPDGSLAVSVTAVDEEGALVAMLALLESSGELTRVIKTSPFSATSIAFTGDGNLWAVGVEKDSSFQEVANYSVLRKYTPEGEQVGDFLPRSGFPQSQRAAALYSVLAGSRDKVAFLSAETGEVNVVSADGLLLHRGLVVIPEGLRLVTGALTQSGRFFVAAKRSGVDEPMLPVYEVDFDKGVLVSVDVSQAVSASRLGYLMGADADGLVLFSLTEGDNPSLVWAKLR